MEFVLVMSDPAYYSLLGFHTNQIKPLLTTLFISLNG